MRSARFHARRACSYRVRTAIHRAWLVARHSVGQRERRKITEGLSIEPTASSRSIRPSLARYDQQLVHLRGALSKGIIAGDSEATEAIRDLVETVTVFRDPTRPGGVTVEIAGRLTALLHEPIFPNNVRGVWGKVVARGRYRLSPHDANLRYFLRSSA